jgi:hypothetical protein
MSPWISPLQAWYLRILLEIEKELPFPLGFWRK